MRCPAPAASSPSQLSRVRYRLCYCFWQMAAKGLEEGVTFLICAKVEDKLAEALRAR